MCIKFQFSFMASNKNIVGLTPETSDQIGLILFHGGCPDGNAAASCFYIQNPNRDFIGVFHGSKPDLERIKDQHVAIVDFTYQRDDMINICLNAKTVVVLDHHKTGFERLAGLENEMSNLVTVFDEQRAGGQIAWDWIFPAHNDDRPQYIDVISDRDLWKFSLSYTKALCAGLYLREYTSSYVKLAQLFYMEKECHEYLPNGLLKCYEQLHHDGEIVLEIDRQYCRRVMFKGVKRQYYYNNEMRNIMIYSNVDYSKRSELGEITFTHHTECDIAIFFDYEYEKEIWNVSLRSRAGLDIEPIAKAYGGGGHPNAAGFILPFGISPKGFFGSDDD